MLAVLCFANFGALSNTEGMKLHFIAIGGSAMHNLAIALKAKGYEISGSDDEIFEPARSRLQRYGILPKEIGWCPEKINTHVDAIILGMHARADNPELLRAQDLGIPIFSYPEFLFEQSASKKRVVIGGSHGKTTITAMILHVLARAGVESDYMVGAQLDGFEVMVKLSETAQWMVMEGDEYLSSPIDRRPKFLLYKPHIAVISGIAWDHINVFPDFEDYLHQFHLFTESIMEGGKLIYYADDAHTKDIAGAFRGSKQAYEAHPYTLENGRFTIQAPKGEQVHLMFFGRHNMANLNAARLVCREMGVSDDAFYKAIVSFKGASKRLEFVAELHGVKIYRDFAHAPSKVQASVHALREQFPGQHLTACMELHTFSSLNEKFIHHYKGSLNAADCAIVFFDPHAVALKRLPMLGKQQIREAFGHPNLHIFNDAGQLRDFLTTNRQPGSVLALMSSGSFNGLEISSL